MTTTAQLEPGITEDRHTPPCPHFGPCGGCQLQHLPYSAQLEEKQAQLRVLLERAGLSVPPIRMHSGPALNYRNRIRLTLAEHRGLLRAGYVSRAKAGDVTPLDAGDPLDEAVDFDSDAPAHVAAAAFVPITECPIAAEILWKATEAFLAEVNRHSVTWMERAPFRLDQLELFTNEDASQLQMSVLVRTASKGLPDRFETELTTLCEAMRERVPALTGAGMYLLPARSRGRRIEQQRPGPAWGSRGLSYTVAGETYWVPRGAFFQINRFLLPELVELVTRDRKGALAWDLYAGVGLFTRFLAKQFSRTTAVEGADPAFTALASTKTPNRYAVKSTTVEFLEHALVQRDRPDVIVVDPPRSGAGDAVAELLGRIQAPEIVYVSCSPHALPAELTILCAAGYEIAEMHLLDLFPQTGHIETVSVLRRAK
jgi:23S rRNA (uracil1939-C5)-methyltransferase